jgi:4,5-DOPA dioxygenase extradiol
MSAISASPSDRPQPVLFLGHGSPLNAIEDNAWSRAWRALGERLPRPRAILCVSAHWETPGPWLTGSEAPDTIHDFGGFPQALFDVRWPARGDPALAQRVVELLGDAFAARIDPKRGLDHGAWGGWRRCATTAYWWSPAATSSTTCGCSIGAIRRRCRGRCASATAPMR